MSWAPIFVVGVGRSGTSLLQSMLAAHPEVAFPPETNFIRRYLATGALSREWERGGLPEVRAVLSEDRYLRRLPLGLTELLAPFAAGRPFSEAALYETILTSYASAAGKPRCGDKDPRSIEYLPLLRKYWPDAHIVHIIRDPRDVLASKKKAAWSRDRPSLQHVFANMVQLRIGREVGPSLFGDHYHEVLYESLLADPEGELRRLSRALGMAYSDEMLAFSRAAERLVSESEMSWKKETLGALLPGNAGKWQGELNGWEVALTELACREAFRVGGYEESHGLRSLPMQQRALVRAAHLVLRSAGRLYRTYRGSVLRSRLRPPRHRKPGEA